MYSLEYLNSSAITEVAAQINGKWVPCRPVSWGGLYGFTLRLKDAWAVLTGKADAFEWPEGQ